MRIYQLTRHILTQYWLNVDQTSETLVQHCDNSMQSRVFVGMANTLSEQIYSKIKLNLEK